MQNINLIKDGNIFHSKMEALVCPVNCLGIMGAGLAKQFRDNIEFEVQNTLYKDCCNQGLLAPGSVLVAPTKNGKSIVYFATKMDWRDPSKMEWIEHGLQNLYRALYHYKITSVAIPAIGAGLGDLPWPPIEMMVLGLFKNETIQVEVYSPLK